MPEFKEIIQKLRKEKDLSQVEFAKCIGISKSTVAMWETGKRFPSNNIYEELADFFNVDIDYLYGRTDIRQKIHFYNDGTMYAPVNKQLHMKNNDSLKTYRIPVLDHVAARTPLEAIDYIIDYEEIPEELAKTGEFFGLKIKGDSMEPRIREGDVVIVRKQEDAETGDIIVALINGDNATCKRLKKYADGIMLLSNNPAYEPFIFSYDEVREKPVHIIGKVIELRGKL